MPDPDISPHSTSHFDAILCCYQIYNPAALTATAGHRMVVRISGQVGYFLFELGIKRVPGISPEHSIEKEVEELSADHFVQKEKHAEWRNYLIGIIDRPKLAAITN